MSEFQTTFFQVLKEDSRFVPGSSVNIGTEDRPHVVTVHTRSADGVVVMQKDGSFVELKYANQNYNIDELTANFRLSFWHIVAWVCLMVGSILDAVKDWQWQSMDFLFDIIELKITEVLRNVFVANAIFILVCAILYKLDIAINNRKRVS